MVHISAAAGAAVGQGEESGRDHPTRRHCDGVDTQRVVGRYGYGDHPGGVGCRGEGRRNRQPRPVGRRREGQHSPRTDRVGGFAGQGYDQGQPKGPAGSNRLAVAALDRQCVILHFIGPHIGDQVERTRLAAQVDERRSGCGTGVDGRAGGQQTQVAGGGVAIERVNRIVAHPATEGVQTAAAAAAAISALHQAVVDHRRAAVVVNLRAIDCCVVPQDDIREWDVCAGGVVECAACVCGRVPAQGRIGQRWTGRPTVLRQSVDRRAVGGAVGAEEGIGQRQADAAAAVGCCVEGAAVLQRAVAAEGD